MGAGSGALVGITGKSAALAAAVAPSQSAAATTNFFIFDAFATVKTLLLQRQYQRVGFSAVTEGQRSQQKRGPGCSRTKAALRRLRGFGMTGLRRRLPHGEVSGVRVAESLRLA